MSFQIINHHDPHPSVSATPQNSLSDTGFCVVINEVNSFNDRKKYLLSQNPWKPDKNYNYKTDVSPAKRQLLLVDLMRAAIHIERLVHLFKNDREKDVKENVEQTAEVLGLALLPSSVTSLKSLQKVWKITTDTHYLYLFWSTLPELKGKNF